MTACLQKSKRGKEKEARLASQPHGSEFMTSVSALACEQIGTGCKSTCVVLLHHGFQVKGKKRMNALILAPRDSE